MKRNRGEKQRLDEDLRVLGAGGSVGASAWFGNWFANYMIETFDLDEFFADWWDGPGGLAADPRDPTGFFPQTNVKSSDWMRPGHQPMVYPWLSRGITDTWAGVVNIERGKRFREVLDEEFSTSRHKLSWTGDSNKDLANLEYALNSRYTTAAEKNRAWHRIRENLIQKEVKIRRSPEITLTYQRIGKGGYKALPSGTKVTTYDTFTRTHYNPYVLQKNEAGETRAPHKMAILNGLADHYGMSGEQWKTEFYDKFTSEDVRKLINMSETDRRKFWEPLLRNAVEGKVVGAKLALLKSRYDSIDNLSAEDEQGTAHFVSQFGETRWGGMNSQERQDWIEKEESWKSAIELGKEPGQSAARRSIPGWTPEILTNWWDAIWEDTEEEEKQKRKERVRLGEVDNYLMQMAQGQAKEELALVDEVENKPFKYSYDPLDDPAFTPVAGGPKEPFVGAPRVPLSKEAPWESRFDVVPPTQTIPPAPEPEPLRPPSRRPSLLETLSEKKRKMTRKEKVDRIVLEETRNFRFLNISSEEENVVNVVKKELFEEANIWDKEYWADKWENIKSGLTSWDPEEEEVEPEPSPPVDVVQPSPDIADIELDPTNIPAVKTDLPEPTHIDPYGIAEPPKTSRYTGPRGQQYERLPGYIDEAGQRYSTAIVLDIKDQESYDSAQEYLRKYLKQGPTGPTKGAIEGVWEPSTSKLTLSDEFWLGGLYGMKGTPGAISYQSGGVLSPAFIAAARTGGKPTEEETALSKRNEKLDKFLLQIANGEYPEAHFDPNTGDLHVGLPQRIWDEYTGKPRSATEEAMDVAFFAMDAADIATLGTSLVATVPLKAGLKMVLSSVIPMSLRSLRKEMRKKGREMTVEGLEYEFRGIIRKALARRVGKSELDEIMKHMPTKELERVFAAAVRSGEHDISDAARRQILGLPSSSTEATKNLFQGVSGAARHRIRAERKATAQYARWQATRQAQLDDAAKYVKDIEARRIELPSELAGAATRHTDDAGRSMFQGMGIDDLIVRNPEWFTKLERAELRGTADDFVEPMSVLMNKRITSVGDEVWDINFNVANAVIKRQAGNKALSKAAVEGYEKALPKMTLEALEREFQTMSIALPAPVGGISFWGKVGDWLGSFARRPHRGMSVSDIFSYKRIKKGWKYRNDPNARAALAEIARFEQLKRVFPEHFVDQATGLPKFKLDSHYGSWLLQESNSMDHLLERIIKEEIMKLSEAIPASQPTGPPQEQVNVEPEVDKLFNELAPQKVEQDKNLNYDGLDAEKIAKQKALELYTTVKQPPLDPRTAGDIIRKKWRRRINQIPV